MNQQLSIEEVIVTRAFQEAYAKRNEVSRLVLHYGISDGMFYLMEPDAAYRVFAGPFKGAIAAVRFWEAVKTYQHLGGRGGVMEKHWGEYAVGPQPLAEPLQMENQPEPQVDPDQHTPPHHHEWHVGVVGSYEYCKICGEHRQR